MKKKKTLTALTLGISLAISTPALAKDTVCTDGRFISENGTIMYPKNYDYSKEGGCIPLQAAEHTPDHTNKKLYPDWSTGKSELRNFPKEEKKEYTSDLRKKSDEQGYSRIYGIIMHIDEESLPVRFIKSVSEKDEEKETGYYNDGGIGYGIGIGESMGMAATQLEYEIIIVEDLEQQRQIKLIMPGPSSYVEREMVEFFYNPIEKTSYSSMVATMTSSTVDDENPESIQKGYITANGIIVKHQSKSY